MIFLSKRLVQQAPTNTILYKQGRTGDYLIIHLLLLGQPRICQMPKIKDVVVQTKPSSQCGREVWEGFNKWLWNWQMSVRRHYEVNKIGGLPSGVVWGKRETHSCKRSTVDQLYKRAQRANGTAPSNNYPNCLRIVGHWSMPRISFPFFSLGNENNEFVSVKSAYVKYKTNCRTK